MTPGEVQFIWSALGGIGVGGAIAGGVAYLLLKSYVPAYLSEKAKNLANREDIAALTREIERTKAEFVQQFVYLGEKGKNLATKEDVAEITREIEAVKSEYTMLAEQFKAKNQLRVAAIDKRLAAHQQAFTLWRKLITVLWEGDLHGIVQECNSWWAENCLYLEPLARDAFSLAYLLAPSHRQLADGVRFHGTQYADDMESRVQKILKAGEVILQAVQLPGLTTVEEAQLKQTAEQQSLPL